MAAEQRALLWLNIVGGTAVLASYVYGLDRLGDDAQLAWGGVPATWRGLYTVNMFAAAAGYFPFTSFLLFAVDAAAVRIAGRLPYSTFRWIYLVILVGSALWLPLTCIWIERGGSLLWAAIHLDLLAVGAASLALLAALATLTPRRPAWWYAAALVGVIPFFVQTAVLDAIVWPAYAAR
jgi:hypothetical protein